MDFKSKSKFWDIFLGAPKFKEYFIINSPWMEQTCI